MLRVMAAVAVARSSSPDEAHAAAARKSVVAAPARREAQRGAPGAHELAETAARRALLLGPARARVEHEAERVARRQSPAGRQPLRCACGGTPGPDGECEACKAKRLALEEAAARGPVARAEPGTDPETDEEGPPVGRAELPHAGSATIVCDGRGGYRVDPGWAATATCGIGRCVTLHEQSHITDWKRRWPDGCKNADGTAKADGATIPLGGPGYAAFLKASECTAYGVEIPCEEGLLAGASDACKPTIQTVLDDSRRQKTSFCAA